MAKGFWTPATSGAKLIPAAAWSCVTRCSLSLAVDAAETHVALVAPAASVRKLGYIRPPIAQESVIANGQPRPAIDVPPSPSAIAVRHRRPAIAVPPSLAPQTAHAGMAAMNFVTFNQDHSHLGVGMQGPCAQEQALNVR